MLGGQVVWNTWKDCTGTGYVWLESAAQLVGAQHSFEATNEMS